MVGESCLLEKPRSRRHANYTLEWSLPGTSCSCFKIQLSGLLALQLVWQYTRTNVLGNRQSIIRNFWNVVNVQTVHTWRKFPDLRYSISIRDCHICMYSPLWSHHAYWCIKFITNSVEFIMEIKTSHYLGNNLYCLRSKVHPCNYWTLVPNLMVLFGSLVCRLQTHELTSSWTHTGNILWFFADIAPATFYKSDVLLLPSVFELCKS